MLLDSDVMIDVLREHPPAIAWLRSLGDEAVGLPGFVVMELIQGCRDRREQQRVESEVRSCDVYWPSQVDCVRACQDFATYHLSHTIGILDAVIAETAVGLGETLATYNTKHYDIITSLKTIEPYTRGSQSQP